jgi:acetyl esterase/lipase
VALWVPSPLWAGSSAANLLPAETDIIVTFNPHSLLVDCQDIPVLARYFQQYRLAAKGNEKQLLDYYQSEQIQKYEGISAKEFLERAALIKAACAALASNPFEDIGTVTVAYSLGEKSYLGVIVEGKFQQRGIELLEQFVSKHFAEVNQRDGYALAKFDESTLVFADSGKTLDAMRARAANKTSELPAGVRTLLEDGQKLQLSILINNTKANAERLTKFIREDILKSVNMDHPFAKFIVDQEFKWIEKWAADYAAVSLGISIHKSDIKIQLGLDARNAAKAEELGKFLQSSAFWSVLALKAVDHDLARDLGKILEHQKTNRKDSALLLDLTIPHEFVLAVLRHPLLDILPVSGVASAKIKPLPGQELLEKLGRQATRIPYWKPVVSTADVEEVLDVPYKTGPGSDPYFNQLDIYLPKKKKDFPVVVLVHGGAWTMGDNRAAGLYTSVGQFLASQGIGAVLPNYRLSPAVKHPEHVKDVAAAVGWTRRNIGKYGGNPEKLYLIGHSAGGHLVALLATDESYLKAEDMKSSDIKGVIPISGVYRIPDGLMYGAIGGSGPRCLRIEELVPLRGDNGPSWKWHPPGLPLALDVFGPVFGDSEKVRAQASPINHIHKNMPPILMLSAEHDLPNQIPQAEDFHNALREKGCDVKLIQVLKRNHASLMFSAIAPEDPAARTILDFIRK